MAEMGENVYSAGRKSHEYHVMSRAFAALELAGLSQEEISDVFGWTPGRMAQLLDEHGTDIAEEQSKVRALALKDLDVEDLVKAHLVSLVNQAYLFYQDLLNGCTPPGAIRPYEPLGEVSPQDRAKAAGFIMSLGLKLGRDVVDVTTLEPPMLPCDVPTTLSKREKVNGKQL